MGTAPDNSSGSVEEWSGTDVSISEIESELARLRAESADEGGHPRQRTSVMTHVAWVPPEWLDAAERVLDGLRERHPSRTVILVPQPGGEGGIDAELSVRSFSIGQRCVAGEVIQLSLRGDRCVAPASIVLPLAISDLPVFVRWRGEPPFGETQWDQLVGIADRVIVDSSEWNELRYAQLAEAFSRTAVSDIAWSRTGLWRAELAERWPEIAELEVSIRGPRAEAALLRGWLVSRLDRELPPPEQEGDLGVRLDGEEVSPPRDEQLTPSDLLSAELDRLARDRVYEAAATAVG
jgi:Glucose-6-phosphate dehydrogenase subunit